MATTQYHIHIDTKGKIADFKVKYKNGHFQSIEKVRGQLSQEQHERLLVLAPQLEQVILILQSEYEGRVSWKKIEKEPSLHERFVDFYLTWYEEKFQIKPVLKPQDFAALKWIKETISSMSVDDQEAHLSWDFILTNWDKQDSWYQSQTELVQIKRNFNVILKILKHGKSTEQGARAANDVANDYRQKFQD